MMLLKAVFVLIIVIALLYGSLKLLQKYSKFGSNGGYQSGSVRIENVLYLDEATKVVTLQSSLGGKYIIASGKNNMILLDKISASRVQEIEEQA